MGKMAEKEYIERDSVLRSLAELMQLPFTDWNDAWEVVQKTPAADVAPVVHGEWDEIPNVYMSVASKNGSHRSNATSCSACQEVNPNAYRTNYCPNCGAKMDGKNCVLRTEDTP